MFESISSAAGLALAIVLSVDAVAAGQEPVPGPLDVIRQSNTDVLGVFGDHDELDAAGESQVRRLMNEYTDFEALSSATIDDLCVQFEPHKCREFKDTFSELLRVSSIRKLGRYRADRFEYLSEAIDGEVATVSTIAHYGDRAVPLDYLLRRSDGAWRIVDYTLNRVNTVRVYRKQFIRLLGAETLDEVIARLRRKIGELTGT